MDDLLSASKKGIEFLKQVQPDGPWCLSAVKPNVKGMETRTFYPKTEAELYEWLAENNGIKNLYWSVNEVSGLLKKKAEKADIKAAHFLYVDIDPGQLVDLKAAQEDILKRLVIDRPKGVPEPTIIIFSGGGYQAFWKLREPLPISGNADKAHDYERYNQWLGMKLGADNCHNVDRIMRLPGSVNIPDAKKQAKGRTKALATVISYRPELVYDLSEFDQVADKRKVALPNPRTELQGELQRIKDLNELDEWEVPARTKMIINHGAHPDADEVARKASKTGKTPTRSEWLWEVCCELARCNVPDEVIYGVITDPAWGISESVLEQKNVHRYAMKQINDAKDAAVCPELSELNREFAITRMGKHTVVVRYTNEYYGVDSLGRPRVRRVIKPMLTDAFIKWHCNRNVQVGTDKDGKPVTQELGKWWMRHAKRRQYEEVVFAPNRDIPNVLNLWLGFAYEPTHGERHLGYKEFIREVICQNDSVKFDYLWKWMARGVQQPDQCGEVAVCVRGDKGAGKSFAAETWASLFGQHHLVLNNQDHLTGKFNAHFRDCCAVIIDEPSAITDRKHIAYTNGLITGGMIAVEGKGDNIEKVPNLLKFWFISNDDHIVSASKDERRYFVVTASNRYRLNTEFFAALKYELDNGGYGDLLGELLSVDLSGFDVRKVPQTEELADQKTLTRGSGELYDYLDELLSDIPFGCISHKDLMAVLPEPVLRRADKGELKRSMAALGWHVQSVRPWRADGERDEPCDRYTVKGLPPVPVGVVKVYSPDQGMVPGSLALPDTISEKALIDWVDRQWALLEKLTPRVQRSYVHKATVYE